MRIDLTGTRFGRLLVVSRAPNIGKLVCYYCLCDCGTRRVIWASNLRNATTKSCGCLRREIARERQFRHGHTSGGIISPVYGVWKKMHERCYDVKHFAFNRYGGRGIQVCVRWHKSNLNGFQNFFKDMGERPEGKSLDRIQNDGHYMPSNCRWATAKEQSNNRSK